MTSDVKGWEQLFLGLHAVFGPSCLTRVGARKRRRLSLLLSVGWLPPSLPPSGACLSLGTRILYKPLNAVEGDTTPGLRLFQCLVKPVSRLLPGQDRLGVEEVTGTCWAMAHINALRSRAMATPTRWGCLPRAIRCRERVHRRTCAFQLISWRGLGRWSRRHWRCRRTFAGSR